MRIKWVDIEFRMMKKKIPITISIRKKLLNELNEKGINRSKLFEELLIKYLKKNNKK